MNQQLDSMPEGWVPDLGTLIRIGKEDEAIALLRDHPEMQHYRNNLGACAFRIAFDRGRNKVCGYLESVGADLGIDELVQGITALEHAISLGKTDRVAKLLMLGADPNVGRTIFTASNCHGVAGLEALKLLIEYRVDVNQLFAIFGDRKNPKSPLDFCRGRKDFAEVLKAAGAKTASEILKYNPNAPISDDEE